MAGEKQREESGTEMTPINRREVFVQGRYVSVTRRFLDKSSGRMRVRLSIKDSSGTICHTEFKDYDGMHEGDKAYRSLIQHFEEKAKTR